MHGVPRTYLVTTDPPTPNGDLHVGHLSGPYFASDVLVKALRQRGERVAYLSNLDPHQSYVDSKARRSGREPGEILEHFGPRIRRVLAEDAIELDLMGTADERQGVAVDAFFCRLWEGGKIAAREMEIPYCAECDQHLFEAYVEGVCPNCGVTAYGNSCETCRRPSLTGDMGKPRCRLCERPSRERRTYRGLVLPLERYRQELKVLVEARRGRWRETLTRLVSEPLKAPLPDIPLSFVGRYGLAVGIPGFEGQVYNVRLEILPALVDTFERWREAGGTWHWRDAEDLEVIAFHGTENGYQYAVSFNALLVAAGQLAAETGSEPLAWAPPEHNITNEFYLLEGEKFSTTRGHAVWGLEALAASSSDALRFYLALTNPETEETSFSWPELSEGVQRHLSGPWDRLHRSLGRDLASGEGGGLPSAGALEALEQFSRAMDEALSVEAFSLRRAAAAVAGWLERPWDRSSAADLRLAAAALGWYGYPLLPELCGRLQEALGIKAPPTGEVDSVRPVASVAWGDQLRVHAPEPLAAAS